MCSQTSVSESFSPGISLSEHCFSKSQLKTEDNTYYAVLLSKFGPTVMDK